MSLTPEVLSKLSVIHVAGTKGKGSTCALVESILRHSTKGLSSPSHSHSSSLHIVLVFMEGICCYIIYSSFCSSSCSCSSSSSFSTYFLFFFFFLLVMLLLLPVIVLVLLLPLLTILFFLSSFRDQDWIVRFTSFSGTHRKDSN
jgi:hypothetical protein